MGGGSDVDRTQGDMEILRQHVILHLLQRIPMGPDALCAAVQQLLQRGVLTRDVLPELSLTGLCADAVREIPPPLQPVGAAALLPVAPLGCSDPSRFEREFDRVELLGRGAFGEVWRCRHRLDGREYAVKSVVYRANAADRIESRVLREAQTWASMEHPHIARYHSAWVEAARPDVLAGVQVQGPGGLVLPLAPGPARPPQTDAATSVALTADESDGGVIFREASDGLSRSALGTEPRGAAEAAPAPNGVVATRAAAAGGGLGTSLAGQVSGYRAVLYIQTELCSKDTLAAWVAKRNAAWADGATPPKDRRRWTLEACRIFQQCASAVAHLHAQRCVHRDLKPSNVFFARDGSVRLGDFGLAKVVGSQMALEDRRSGPGAGGGPPPSAAPLPETRGVGTPTYASPEQLAGGTCGVKADVYALGVMLAELLTPVGTQMERARLLEDLRRGHWAPSGALPRTAGLVAAMTHPDPFHRPTVEEVLEAFPDAARESRQRLSSRALPGPAVEDCRGSETEQAAA